MRNKILNIVELGIGVIGFVISFFVKNYLACVLWLMIILEDLRLHKLEDIIEMQKELLSIKDKRIENLDNLYKTCLEQLTKGNEEPNGYN